MARMSVTERRARLVDAAIEVMVRDGVARTTTRAIVAEAGMQIGVFHYCFRSKDELILEVVRTIGRRSFQAVIGVVGDSTELSEVMHLATGAYWEYLRAHPLEHLLVFELTHYALRQPGDTGAAAQQYAANYAGTERFLRRVADLTGCTWSTPVDQLARLMLATVDGITLQWVVSRDETMTPLLLDQLATQLAADAGLAARE